MNLEGLTEKRNHMGTVYYVDEIGDIIAKVCAKCGETKLLSDYHKHKEGLGGRVPSCRYCKSEADKAYRECSKERRAETRKIWYENNKERESESRRIHHENNRVKEAETSRIWTENNRDKIRLSKQRRRARKLLLPDTLTKEEYTNSINYFGGCALTGEPVNFELDHAIPLAVGHGGTTKDNCYPLRSDLNKSKNDRNIFEWFDANKQRLKMSEERFNRLIKWLANKNEMTIEEYRDYVYKCHAHPNVIIETSAN